MNFPTREPSGPEETDSIGDAILEVRDLFGNERRSVEQWCERNRTVFTMDLFAQALADANAHMPEL